MKLRWLGARTKRLGSETRLLRGYGPALVWIGAFSLMIAMAPTIAPQRVVTANVASSNDTTSETIVDAGTEGAAGSAGSGGAVSCPGPQIEGDPYSPPCRAWGGGNNGGATTAGVTKDTITVAFRDLGGSYDLGAAISQLTGKQVDLGAITLDDVVRTWNTLITYFNKNFEFYGRKIEMKVFRGQGSATDELLGGGQAGANADAINEAQQVKAFANLGSPESPVFAEALAKQRVLSTNVVYPDISLYRRSAPFAYGVIPDCTKVARASADFILKQVADHPVLAGQYKGKPRRLGLVYPESPSYAGCGAELKRILADAGEPVADTREYRLSLDGIPPDARDIASTFANQGITTVVLFSDPLIPYFMTAAAEQGNWHPEWMPLGIAYIDNDFVAQLYEPNQWKHAFGLSFNAPPVPARSTTAYAAYRSIDPNTSPVPLLVETMYYQLYLFATGIHMAGPNLTPATFGEALRAYRPAQTTGPNGSWLVAPGQFTAKTDSRIVWWDTEAVSALNGTKGAYRDNGLRYPFGSIPAGALNVPIAP